MQCSLQEQNRTMNNDFLTAMGRTNDAIIFAGITQLLVSTTDEMAEELCNKMPSSTSNDYGKPFADIFKEYEYDFFKIDANLFSPSKVIISNMKTDMFIIYL